MRKFSFFLIVILTTQLNSFSQEIPHNHNVYDISWRQDGPILGIGLTAAAIGSYMVLNVKAPSAIQIEGLDKSGIWAFDRGATDNFSQTAETISDVILYSSLAIPFFIHTFDDCKESRKEIVLITAETFLTISALTNIAKGSTKRYRPYNYNPEVGDELKLDQGSRLSFFSGHVSHTTALWFMTAQILTDMHPHWKRKKYITWGLATGLPLAIGYGRFLAGKHFPTDVITGYVLGAGVGLLIPRIHRNHKFSGIIGPNGVGISYNLN